MECIIQVSADELGLGAVYPGLGRLRDVSVAIAVAVAEHMFDTSRSTKELPLSSYAHSREKEIEALTAHCRRAMYTPSYDDLANRGQLAYIRSRL